MEISVIKEALLEKVDVELAALEKSVSVGKRNQAFFSELEIKTAFRNALYNAPISSGLTYFIMGREDILHDMYDFSATNNYFLDSSDTMEGSVYNATIAYLEKAERVYLAKKLYNCALTEYELYIENVKAMPPDEIIKEAHKITDVYELMCCLHPDRAILDNNRLKGLLTVDGPLMSLYGQWLERDLTYTNAMVDVIQTAADSLDLEDDYYNADLDIHGRHDLLSDDEDEHEP